MAWNPTALLEALDESVAVYETDGTILYVNAATEKLFGPRAGLLGKRLWDLFPEAVGNEFHRAFQRAAETGQSQSFDHHYLPWDRWFRNQIVAVDGKIHVVATDVTGAKQAELRMQGLASASKAFSRAMSLPELFGGIARMLAESIGDACGVRILDAAGTSLETVALHHPDEETYLRYRELMGEAVPLGDGISTTVLFGEPLIVPVVDRPALIAKLSKERHRSGIEQSRIHSLMSVALRDGDRRAGLITMTRDRTSHPYTQADLSILCDLADRASMALTRIGAFERVERERRATLDANRRKDEFLALLGHELRNPLAPILTALQLMSLKRLDGGEREREIIERHARHLVRLVDDLLDISRITRGMVELRRERADLAAVISHAIEMASPLLEQNQHTLHLEVPRGRLYGDVDEARLAQVFQNLITNAAKYTPPGGNVRIRMREAETAAVISVEDDGGGISPELLSTIFEPFVQGDRSVDRSQGGLGLGLALVQSLVTLHGGTVAAASEGEGRGSCFTVSLPLSKKAETPSVAPQPAARRTSVGGASRILLVDDNRDAAALLAELLGREGYEVRVALDGFGALSAAEAFHPDVAVLDIGLPVMDGYELARRMLAASSPPPLLIALTGYGQDHNRRRSREAGFAEHLVKPVDVDVLIEAICRALARQAAAIS